MGRWTTVTDQDILQRARPVFLARGVGARTRDLAAAVGLTWGAIAFRFGSKRALFELAMAPGSAAPEPCPCDACPELGALLRHLRLDLGSRWPMGLQLKLSSSRSQTGPVLPEELHRWLASKLAGFADRGQIRSDLTPKSVAALIVTTLTGDAAEHFLADRESEPCDDGLIETIVDLLRPRTP